MEPYLRRLGNQLNIFPDVTILLPLPNKGKSPLITTGEKLRGHSEKRSLFFMDNPSSCIGKSEINLGSFL